MAHRVSGTRTPANFCWSSVGNVGLLARPTNPPVAGARGSVHEHIYVRTYTYAHTRTRARTNTILMHAHTSMCDYISCARMLISGLAGVTHN
jgi:hypothetical protein